ncbi:MAG: hypothetical protein A2133_05390 [Actinobacteria bacterium RBG_16_64_13]|nr:MAG: hypothetical protein A2133_05390 [Actinobacteria bacterium RBG_16_64_13]
MKNQTGSRFSEVYDFWSGHLDWLDPAPSDLDAEIRSFCDHFVSADPQQRAQMTESLDSGDSYQLQCFANRAAIFGLRTSDLQGLRHGLTAASVVNASSVDPRDRQGPLCRLYYCLFSLGLHPRREFDEAAARVEGEMLEAVQWVRKRCSRYRSGKDFRNEMVIPVKTQSGAGFIDTWVEPYDSTADLVGSVLQLVPILRADPRYQFESVREASFLPFPLRGVIVLGVAECKALLRPDFDLRAESGPLFQQWLRLLVAETKTEDRATRLAKKADGHWEASSGFVGVARGRFVGIASVFHPVHDGQLVETRESLERLREPLSSAIEDLSRQRRRLGGFWTRWSAD